METQSKVPERSSQEAKIKAFIEIVVLIELTVPLAEINQIFRCLLPLNKLQSISQTSQFPKTTYSLSLIIHHLNNSPSINIINLKLKLKWFKRADSRWSLPPICPSKAKLFLYRFLKYPIKLIQQQKFSQFLTNLLLLTLKQQVDRIVFFILITKERS